MTDLWLNKLIVGFCKVDFLQIWLWVFSFWRVKLKNSIEKQWQILVFLGFEPQYRWVVHRIHTNPLTLTLNSNYSNVSLSFATPTEKIINDIPQSKKNANPNKYHIDLSRNSSRKTHSNKTEPKKIITEKIHSRDKRKKKYNKLITEFTSNNNN